MKKSVVLILFFMNFTFCMAVDGHKVDSLKSVLDTNFIDTTTVKTLIELAILHQLDSNQLVKYYAEISIRMSLKLNYLKGLTEGYRQLAVVHYYAGEYDSAISYWERTISIDSTIGNINGVSATYNNLGLVYDTRGDYPTALKYYYKSLEIDERTDNKHGILSSLNNIGLVHDVLGNYDEALKVQTQAYDLAKSIGDKESLAAASINIGRVYEVTGEYKKALEYHFEALKHYEEKNNQHLMGTAYTNIAVNYEYLEEFTKAEKYYNLAIAIHTQIKSDQGLISDYFNIAQLKRKQKQYDKSIDYLSKALQMAKEQEDAHDQLTIYEIMAQTYNEMGDGSSAYQYQRQFSVIWDSLYTSEKTEQIANMEAKYQNEKKQLQIENLEQEQIIQLEVNQKQRILIVASVGVIVIILIFSIIVFRLFKQKKKANILLASQNDEIKQKNEEISSQRDEIEAQRDAITTHRDVILGQKEEIEDSINYAKRIQEAVMPSERMSNMILGEHFILFRPKDIVSGDFYWTTKTEDWTIIAAADCTGHGVPGAFMSMLGVSFLNEIVRKKEVTDSAEVLNQLRSYIIEALKQTSFDEPDIYRMTDGNMKDGMDMSIIAIHKDRKRALWAGANNPLYMIRNTCKDTSEDPEKNHHLVNPCRGMDQRMSVFKEEQQEEQQEQHRKQELDTLPYLVEIKADKQPVSIHVKMEPFTNHEIELNKGDQIYLFTDGFPDQFGGEKGKKFKYKAFKELLVSNHKKPMSEQKLLLENALNNWMSFTDDKGHSYEQVDDITVVGIRF